GPHTVGPNVFLGSPLGVGLDRSGNIYVSEAEDNDVSVYTAGSDGKIAAPAMIEPVTGMSAPAGITLDAGANIYVTNEGNNSVTVYPAGSNANVAPSATIAGPDTGLGAPNGIAIAARGTIYVANAQANSVTAYPPGSNGDAAPSATISGANTGLYEPGGIALDSAGNIYVTVTNPNLGPGAVNVYSAGSNGNVAPGFVIGGTNPHLGFGPAGPRGIVIDRAGEIDVAVPQHEGGSAIEFFAPGSSGDVNPVATISGCTSRLFSPSAVALDAVGNILVANGTEYALSCNPMSGGNDVLVYGAGSNGDVAPIVSIAGAATDLAGAAGIAVH